MTMRVKTTITGVSGSPYLAVHHFDAPTEDTASSTAAAQLVRGFWAAIASSGWLPTTIAVVQPTVDWFDPATGDLVGQAAVSGVGPVVGGATGVDPLPYATQGLVRWVTTTFSEGRHVQGRTFIPALTEASSIGVPSSTLITLVNTAIVAMLGTGPDLTIWTRPRHADLTHVPPISARVGFSSVVSAGTLQPKFAVLRSRRD